MQYINKFIKWFYETLLEFFEKLIIIINKLQLSQIGKFLFLTCITAHFLSCCPEMVVSKVVKQCCLDYLKGYKDSIWFIKQTFYDFARGYSTDGKLNELYRTALQDMRVDHAKSIDELKNFHNNTLHSISALNQNQINIMQQEIKRLSDFQISESKVAAQLTLQNRELLEALAKTQQGSSFFKVGSIVGLLNGGLGLCLNLKNLFNTPSTSLGGEAGEVLDLLKYLKTGLDSVISTRPVAGEPVLPRGASTSQSNYSRDDLSDSD